MEIERPAVDGGEKVSPQPGNDQNQGTHASGEECDKESTAMMKAKFEQSVITLTETLKCFLKPNLHANEWIAGFRGIRGVMAQEVLGHHRDNGA